MKRSITDIFISKPVLAVVVNLVIVLIGWRAIASLGVQQYPKIESSSIQIMTVYTGASAETIRGFITTRIERAVAAISGIDYIESQSVPGLSTVTVRLKLNHRSTDALAEVSARLDQVRSELPREAESPTVEVVRTDRPYASFYLAFSASTMDRTQLSEYLDRVIVPDLGTLKNVQKSQLEGKRQLAMRIWLKPDVMSSLGITPEQVQAAMLRNNFLAAVGRTKGKETQIDLLADTDLRTPSEFEQLIVRESGGAVVRLGDIARIELGSEEAMLTATQDGKDAVFVSVWPLPGVNEIEVSQNLKQAMERIKPTLPPGIEMSMAYDATTFMSDSLQEIGKTLAETVLIVGVVVFLFMGSIRTALVPLVAMPVSLIGAAVFMVAMGFTLNLLTLLAIVLAVGLVVDDAIVVVENIERHVREGKGRIEAALIGARELTGPVIAMTITLAAVYAPIGIQGGLTGVLFKEFAFTLAAAVIVSGFVALTLSPIMSAYMVREGGKQGRFTRVVNRGFEFVRRAYLAVLDRTLEVKWSVIMASVLATAMAIPMYMFSAKELAPVEDQGHMVLVIESPPNASLEYTEKYGQQLADSMKAFKENEYVWQMVSPAGGFGGMVTKNWRERQAQGMSTVMDLQGQAWGIASGIPGVRAFPIVQAPLPGAGNFDVELIITSFDEAPVLAELGKALVDEAMKSGMFMFAETDLKLDMPQARIMIDREKVADLGLDLAAVGNEVALLLAGAYTNRFTFDGQSYKVIPQVEDQFRGGAEAILNMKIAGPVNADGSRELVQVGQFASIKGEVGPRSLNRFQQKNAVKVYGGVVPGVTKEQGLKLLEDAAKRILPPGAGLEYAGESRQIRAEGSKLVVTLMFALALIYLVLAAQFSSFRDPLVVLAGSVPLAISGALVFSFTGLTTVNIYSQVGLVTLVGLVAKNGILIVEFANHLQEQGMSKLEAIRQASSTRLRPVLMTSAATVFGHLPLVFVTGPGAEARNSIGIVLVAGMTIGTIFTLFVVPSMYLLIAGSKKAHEAEGEKVVAEGAHGGAVVLG